GHRRAADTRAVTTARSHRFDKHIAVTRARFLKCEDIDVDTRRLCGDGALERSSYEDRAEHLIGQRPFDLRATTKKVWVWCGICAAENPRMRTNIVHSCPAPNACPRQARKRNEKMVRR